MSRMPIFFLLASITAAIFGLTDLADYLGNLVMILFSTFTVLFIVSLVVREIALTRKFNKEKTNKNHLTH